MSTGAWPKERHSELVALKEAGTSTADIAGLVGVTHQVASYHLKDVESLSKVLDLLPDYSGEILKIPDRACALTTDWHAPYLSQLWLRRLLHVCLKLGVKDLAIVGDFTDLSWISHYMRKETRGGGLDTDWRTILTTLSLLLNFFDDIWWCYGNHEDRLPMALHGQDMMMASAEGFAEAKGEGKLHMTDMASMLLGDNWRLEHPKTFSRDGAKVAAAAAAIYHKNIATGHAHHLGFKYDVSGLYMGVDLGGMFDIDKQEYLFKTGIMTLPTWNPGFWIYHANGKVQPFEDAFIDWADYGTQ